MSREPFWHRRQRLAREAEDEARFATRATVLLGLEHTSPTEHPDCPTCGADVNGQWAAIDTFAANRQDPAESEVFCLRCVPLRWKQRLLDVLRREE